MNDFIEQVVGEFYSSSAAMSGACSPDFFYREALRLGYVARSAFKLLQMQNQYKLISPGASILDLGCAPGAWLQVACQGLGPAEKGGAVVGIDVKASNRNHELHQNPFSISLHFCRAEGEGPKSPLRLESEDRLRRRDVSFEGSSSSSLPAGLPDLHLQFFDHQSMTSFLSLEKQGRGFSVILSDMCPSVSGIPSKDAALSCELGARAIALAVGSVDLPGFDGSVDVEDGSCGSGVLRAGGNLVVKLLESEDTREFAKFCKPLFKKMSWTRPKATRSSSREIYLVCQGFL